MILTTEKDYVRLKGFDYLREKLYYWPINVEIDRAEEFNQIIQDYVRKKLNKPPNSSKISFKKLLISPSFWVLV